MAQEAAATVRMYAWGLQGDRGGGVGGGSQVETLDGALPWQADGGDSILAGFSKGEARTR